MEYHIKQLDAKKKEQSNKVIELKSKIEAIQSCNESRREVMLKRHSEEKKFLKNQNAYLERFRNQIKLS